MKNNSRQNRKKNLFWIARKNFGLKTVATIGRFLKTVVLLFIELKF